MNNPPNIAIVGATGAVGQEFLRLINERDLSFGELRLLASARSAGRTIRFKDQKHTIIELSENSFTGIDIALFSASGSISRQYAPIAAQAGAVVVDNSSAFRMDPKTPLVIPEINPQEIANHNGIIANPNCSTIVMTVPIWPIHQQVGVERVVVATYQAASGAGAAAMDELAQQARDWAAGDPITQDVFDRQYIWNLFSHNSSIDPDTGYNEEETKMIFETRKLFADPEINVSPTCVRVPVLRAHSEAINLTLKQPLSEEDARDLMASAPGVQVIDDRERNRHPEPLMASDQDDIFVGRIRSDAGQPEGLGLELFVSGDQIRKGAALNAIQIAELLL
ncbi:MAG: aspartate-semialdehyde dehydrogenase [Gammaproteobacteria bacterium]|nr:aspartate-semialdehyde dehydrogenase [Gammaproteobacteria bacterium]RPG25280.1 MAG: aspartate-semialdehyde dehydrogenase [Gammaproteobacteria bacterium TMED50]|tara:strand:+ start:5820 stop:6830 length:1011 start_codon:yes stop_codon:yes gene_type:complete